MKHSVLFLLTILVLAGCNEDNPSVYNPAINAFYQSKVELRADAVTAIIDHPVTLTASFRPMVKGKGRILFWGGGNSIKTQWRIESPVPDTAIRGLAEDQTDVVIPLGFDADSEVHQEWIVRFINSGTYKFRVNVVLDSVYIADSARYFSLDSEVIYRHTPGGYKNWAHSGHFLQLGP